MLADTPIPLAFCLGLGLGLGLSFAGAAAAQGEPDAPRRAPAQPGQPEQPEQPAEPAQQASPSPARAESVTIPSAATATDVPAVVHLPRGYDSEPERRYPVIYFLHGAGRGDEETWDERETGAVVEQLTASGALPLCLVVCPRSPHRMSFYINWKGQPERRHGDFVTSELPAFIDRHYRTQAVREKRALLGDSMGGYGALINAMRHPEVFGAVAAHSPAVYPEDYSALPEWLRGGRGGRPSMLAQLFGEPLDEQWWLDHNLFHLVKQAEPGAFKDLAIYFDVGREDRYGLDRSCAAWHELLERQHIDHDFALREGGHGRRFFAANVEHSLTFLGAAFAGAEQRGADDGEGESGDDAPPARARRGETDGAGEGKGRPSAGGRGTGADRERSSGGR